ncbi:hypothetical protein WOLCODRAFT_148516 [Wolfiporia cocos MD-104 SS10]|uniref:F-box domain-containing protein n=1 Tax=Wolfiporia cocos (strain MD-104) TaxID=742152 RepID=A0A2H3IXM1_WOLCO|nr:hypothetical protein WOLCODRAFT_148516 [Wolfiporia cocos MD-104 SS10]
MSYPRLPLEIRNHITDILGDDDPELEPLRNRTIISCALTCRSCYITDIRSLLRHVTIHRRSQLRGFTMLITDKAHFRRFVKTLLIHDDSLPTNSSLPVFPAMLAGKLPVLEALRIEGNRADVVDWSRLPIHSSFVLLLREFNAVLELSLKGIRFGSLGQFAEVVTSFPQLRVLRCEGLTWTSSKYLPNRRVKASYLACLDIVAAKPERTGELIRWLVTTWPEAPLQNIRLQAHNRQACGDIDALNRLLQGAGSNLRELRINNIHFASTAGCFLGSFLDLSRNSRLRTLVFSVSLWESGTSMDLTGWIAWMLSRISTSEMLDIEITIRGVLYPNRAVHYEQIQRMFDAIGSSRIDAILSAPQFAHMKHARFILAAPRRIRSVPIAPETGPENTNVADGAANDSVFHKPRCWSTKDLFVAKMPTLGARRILQGGWARRPTHA